MSVTAATYRYHCQHQAENFARAILPVPNDYPLRQGLPEDFRPRFARLCELARSIYLDMAKQPEAYGLMLVDIASTDHNLARNGYRTIHRLVDLLANLSRCGALAGNRLVVSLAAFRQANKTGAGLVSGPVPKYELLFTRLSEFGFVFSGFSGKPYGRQVERFTMECPDDPDMMEIIQLYNQCWDDLKNDKSGVVIAPNNFHHHYYRFDYKITAAHEHIPVRQWIAEEADYEGYSPKLKAFTLAFYDYSLRYAGLKFDGDYYNRSKRIARTQQSGWTALNETGKFRLKLSLRSPDSYMREIEAMPESLRLPFTKNYCHYCDFQGATMEKCKFRSHWAFGGEERDGCAHQCFHFEDLDSARVADYWRLLELEYGLKKSEV